MDCACIQRGMHCCALYTPTGGRIGWDDSLPEPRAANSVCERCPLENGRRSGDCYWISSDLQWKSPRRGRFSSFGNLGVFTGTTIHGIFVETGARHSFRQSGGFKTMAHGWEAQEPADAVFIWGALWRFPKWSEEKQVATRLVLLETVWESLLVLISVSRLL